MDIAEFRAFAKNAKIGLSEAEEKELFNYFVQIQGRLDNLKAVTCDFEPLITVCEISNIVREDIAEKNFTREEILSNAAEEHNGYFRVPKTLE